MNHVDHNDLSLLWPVVISNLAICLGYLVVSGALVLTKYRLVFVRRLTYLSGSLFFVTCGLHHAMNAAALIQNPHEDYHVAMLHGAMFVIDAVQAIAVWVFALSAARELADIQRLRGNPTV